MLTKSQLEFLAWLRADQPALYAETMKRATGMQMSGDIDLSWESIVNAAKQAIATKVGGELVKVGQQVDNNINRAENNLPPVNSFGIPMDGKTLAVGVIVVLLLIIAFKKMRK